MRSRTLLIGVATGSGAGLLVLEAGVLALVVVALVAIWGLREPLRPLGLASALVGAGATTTAILVAAQLRCAADASCSMPDQTGYLLVTLLVTAVGVALAVRFVLRRG